MAVTPIRRASMSTQQMSVMPATQASSMPMAASPQQQGWVWNGTSWCWDPDFDCFPPQQGCCPPQSGGSWVWMPCPPVPPSPLPPPPLTGPIIGVTDGSNAAPGQVGEFVMASATLSYPATGNVTGTLSPLIIQPGDWDIWATGSANTDLSGMSFILSPVPAGMSTNMDAVTAGGVVGTPFLEAVTIGAQARGNFTVPTLLAFAIGINTTSGQPAGIFTLTIQARRRR